ncbi:MAG: DUF4345 family protein [Pseudomonadota bacterium]
MRLGFQTSLLLAAFVPLMLGVLTLFEGAARFLPVDLISAQLDGQMRFWAIRSMLPFFLAIWIVRNLDRAGAVLAIVIWATVAGGLARILSVIQYGLSDPAMMGVIAFEIGAVLFLPWYRVVVGGRQERAVA